MSHWEKKARRGLELFDTDKKGFVTERDFMLWADRFSEAFPSATEEQKQRFRQTRMDLWITFLNGGKNPAKGAKVTPEQYIELLRGILGNPEKRAKMREKIASFIKPEYVIVDVNKDGVLQKEDFFKVVKLIAGVDAERAESTFRVVDKNGDGVIQLEEFIDAVTNYALEEEPSDLDDLWGKLD